MGSTFNVAVANIGSNPLAPLDLINLEPTGFDLSSPEELQTLHNRLALEQN